jgi:hypothetical protein
MTPERCRCFLALLTACSLLGGCESLDAQDEMLRLRIAGTVYHIDPVTIEIQARRNGTTQLALPALLEAGKPWRRARDGAGWRWHDGAGAEIVVRPDGPDLSVSIARADESRFSARMPAAAGEDMWIVPDGEGLAFASGDPFWRNEYRNEHCLNGTGGLSFPAWSRIAGDAALTIMLADGLQSALCLRDEDGVQARLTHDFGPGAERVELLLHVGAPNPLAPALAYREMLRRRGLLKTLADKQVPLSTRLYGAQHAYVWGDGRALEFLDRLHALGIERMLLAYDQNPRAPRAGIAGPDYLARAHALGYLAGPYEAFENAQPPETTDASTSDWGDELFPAGCVRDRTGEIVKGFGGRGCELSSEALRQRTTAPNPGSRYAQHAQDGASHVFVDVDAFGNFNEDFSPAHRMTFARDRDNRLARLGLGASQYRFVLGSEHVRAWSHGVAHYSHGSAQAYARAIWRLLRDKERLGGWWPPERPASFFKPVALDAREARALFGAADQLPLFEAAFHDSVVSTDRWGFSLMRFEGLERQRFARALLYGTPTMWDLDKRELVRAGAWLKASHDAFRRAHGWNAPVALTGFAWLTTDRLVQQTTYADGRTIVANFTEAPWRGLGASCVRVTWPRERSVDLCPPEDIVAASAR